MTPDILAPASLATASLASLLLALYLAWPWVSAMMGKSTVRRKLAALEKRGCRVMHQVMLPARNGESIFIDHLLFAPGGVFVITTIARAGAVHGSLRDATWVQEFHGSQHRFPNPLRANAARVDTVRAVLGRKLPIHGLVIIEAGHLAGTLPENIIRPNQLESWVHEHASERTLGDGTLRRLAASIENILLRDEASRREHEASFMAEQGLETRLRTATTLAAASVILMVLAAGVAGWFFVQHRS